MNATIWGVIIGGILFLLAGIGFAIYLYVKSKSSKGFTRPLATPKMISKGGGIQMDKLEDDVFKEFEGAYNDMMDEIKRAENQGDGIDLKDVVKSQATRFTKLNSHFREAKIRMGGN